jgi:hypothetical protein
MSQHGVPNCTVPTLKDHINSSGLVKIMFNYFETGQDYQSCAKLKACIPAKPKIYVTDFLLDATKVASFEESCLFCLEAFDDYGDSTPVFGMPDVQDYRMLIELLINYFESKGATDKIPFLNTLKEEIAREIAYENKYAYKLTDFYYTKHIHIPYNTSPFMEDFPFTAQTVPQYPRPSELVHKRCLRHPFFG